MLNAQIIGGPMDGHITPFAGPLLFTPEPPCFSPFLATDHPAPAFKIRRYVLDHGTDGELYYIDEGHASGA